MNGARILERENQGKWEAGKVDTAGSLKPGIYNIYTASAPDQAKKYDGAIVHADKEFVYQQVGKEFVMHPRAKFDKVPVIGSFKSISYQSGLAIATDAVKLSRGLSR